MAKTFTDNEIKEILELVQHEKHTQYIGARYVPLFGRQNETTIEWNNKAPYEPLTIVLHEGNSYTSRQYVPTGIDITNEEFWALTGNYNAQIEQYRKEVASKLSTVAHDNTVKGSGTTTDPLKVNLNHTTANNDTGNTVYPALAKNKDTGIINGIAFNAGDGLAAYNSDDIDVGSGIRLSDEIQTSIETSEKSSDIFSLENVKTQITSTDEIPDISAILTAMLAKSDKVYIPAGTYAISTPITVSAERKTIYGAGPYQTKLVCTSSLFANWHNLMQLHDLHVQYANSAETLETISGLYVKIDNVHFSNPEHYGKIIIAGSGAASRITGCTFENVSCEISASDFVLNNNNFWCTLTGSVASLNVLSAATNGIISNNEIVPNGNAGIRIASSGTIVTGNYFDGGGITRDTGVGLLLDSASYTTITSNHFWKIKKEAIKTERLTRSIIQNNIFDNCDYFCNKVPDISMSGGSDNISFGNSISHNSFTRIKCSVNKASEINRTTDYNAPICIYTQSANQPVSSVIGNVTNSSDNYNNATGGTNVISMLNNSNIFSSTTNGVQNGDVGTIYRSSGKLYIIDPSHNPIEIGTL